ncbi:signal peptidase I [Jatrophihabitans sp. YIM 134969]
MRDDDPAETTEDTAGADSTARSDQPAEPSAAAETARTPERGGWRARRKASRAERKKAPWWELPVLVIVAVVVAILVKTFLIQPFYIPSASMEKTLHGCEGCSGDRIIVNKPIYTVFRDPHPGDIVVFKAPSSWPDETVATTTSSNPIVKGVRWFGQLVGVVPPNESDLVKRVIAVGGQTVKCCDADGNVQISDDGPNGQFRSLDDPSYTYVDPGSADYGSLPFGPVTVPKDRLWVMGDHRNNSADSRYNCGGQPAPDQPVCADGSEQQAVESTVPVDNVIGKAVLIAWPPSRWTTLGTPPTFENIPLPSAAGDAGLASLATVGPLGVGLVAAGSVGSWRRSRRRPPGRVRARRWLRRRRTRA